MPLSIMADEITVDKETREVLALHRLTASGGCRVKFEIDPEGKVSDPECVSNGCDGSCELRSEDHGSKTKYWCDCN